MLRVDKIFVRLSDDSRTSLCKVRQTLEDKLDRVASSTNYKVEQTELQIEVILQKPISLPTVNQILNSFKDERIIIYDLHWRRKEFGAFRLGYLEIVVS